MDSQIIFGPLSLRHWQNLYVQDQNRSTQSYVQNASNSFQWILQDFLIKKTSPHGKSTSIYKKIKKFYWKQKSWSNLKLTSENFWDRKILENFEKFS